jgi:hypothetical protein
MVEASNGQMQQSTVSDRLETEEKVLGERLDKVKKLRTLLAENPEVQAVMDGLSELGQYYY